MPISYTVAQEGRVVLSVAEGRISVEDLAIHEKHLADDPRVQKGFRELMDARLISGTDITGADLARIADLAGQNPKSEANKRVAMVVADPAHFQLASLYSRLAAGVENVIVFSNLPAARQWLDIPA